MKRLICILFGHSWTEDDRDEQPVINTRWRCRRCDDWYIGSKPWR